MARWIGQLVGVVLALAGVIWLGQGIGLIRGSFMTGSALWAIIGACCLAGGGFVLYRTLRRS
ncbi:MAG: hypothetical protein ACP5QO_12700 [Clostridia bacterium]